MREGFRVELVAAEPLVADPVDIAWGPDGKLWVVEMADYPLGIDGRGKPGGRVRYLEDTDGDGRYDRSTVFLEGLNCPNGVMPWRKGVLVTAAPEVLYAEDTDGDGKADVRRALFRGFGEGNQQHRVNHLRWGLDNWVYLANGDGGAGANGLIRSVKTGKEVEIRGHDVRIRPDSGALDVVTGQAQFGRCRDDWGNWFGCNNRNPGWHYALVDHYLRRNPYVAAPPGRITLNPDAEPIPIGRVISYRRVGYQVPEKGAVRGRFTSIGGMTCYRDELLGPKLRGDVFTSDSVFNVVHRTALVPDGVTFRGKRAPAEQHCEFLASDDPWFRNNTLRTGPDGALYVVAMYRLSIEHPEWIEDQVEEILDLRLGEDRGRIYRVVPEGKKLRPIPRLDRLDTTALVEALDSPNGPQRDLAQQMILWRADKAATEPLEAMATGSERALARLHALCTLDGLGALRAGIVAEALADEHPGVRRHAIRLSESLVNSHPALSAALLKLLDDTDPQVRMQLAYSLGEWKDPRAAVALGRMALEYADDPYLSAAVMSSATAGTEAMIADVKAGSKGTPAHSRLLAMLEQLRDDIKEYPDLGSRIAAARLEAAARTPQTTLSHQTSAERQAALDKFEPVLDMPGDPVRGREVFVEATCAVCHRIGDLGDEIGPDVETLVDRSPKILWVAVCDPNRSVKGRYAEYTAVTTDGLTISGMLKEETSNSITLVDVAGKSHVILRKDLEELVNTGRSHMPEGLDGKLNLQQMADLFAFAGQTTSRSYRQVPGNQPEVITPESDGSVRLLAAKCEIYGEGIRINQKNNCLVWHYKKPEDHVTWSIDVLVPGGYEVWLKWAQIDQYADNPFAVEVDGGSGLVTGTLPSTGDWSKYEDRSFGSLELAAGRRRIALRPDGPIKTELSDVREIRLVPEGLARSFSKQRPAAAHGRALANEANQVKGDVIRPASDGSVRLLAAAGSATGGGIKYLPDRQAFGPFAGTWPRVVWTVNLPKPGNYEVWLEWSAEEKWVGKSFVVEAGAQRFGGKIPSSGGADRWARNKFGKLQLPAGRQRILFRSEESIPTGLCYLRQLHLVPVAADK